MTNDADYPITSLPRDYAAAVPPTATGRMRARGIALYARPMSRDQLAYRLFYALAVDGQVIR